jgi:hypothetical protein
MAEAPAGKSGGLTSSLETIFVKADSANAA